MAFTSGVNNIKMINILALRVILTDSTITISPSNIEQGITLSTASDQSIVLSNGSNFVKSEKASLTWTLVGAMATLNQIYGSINGATCTSLEIDLDNGLHIAISTPKIQMLQSSKTNDNFRIMCTVEKTMGDIDSVVVYS